MRIAIVDDDIRMFERLQTHFGELLGASAELTHFPSGEAFLAVWQPEMFDLSRSGYIHDRADRRGRGERGAEIRP